MCLDRQFAAAASGKFGFRDWVAGLCLVALLEGSASTGQVKQVDRLDASPVSGHLDYGNLKNQSMV